ncbi:threonine aldolase [Microbacterium wangchenii]|uniref:Threonine aldolase n=2 Tax=Microbacteriaceae TaxID=85023 RepID=A0ABX5SR44_9MICO|nr:threonine aldolase [Microbacterium wangchenii]TXK14671.1 threonine aldolase [Microbacterium wangchenii]
MRSRGVWFASRRGSVATPCGGQSASMTDTASTDDRRRMWDASRRAHHLLSGERPLTMTEQLERLTAGSADLDRRGDVYGDGVMRELEERIAAMLGMPDALWLPTGTMAQQIALRCWAERAGTTRVVLHPRHHTLLNEEDAVTALAALTPVFATEEPRYATAEETGAAARGAAAVVFEVPFQDLGYELPPWADFRAAVGAARAADAAVHLDGARLWDAAAVWRRDTAEVAALADSVYLSLYKAPGAMSGAALAGDAELIDRARTWRIRYGGQLFSAWPAVVGALRGLDERVSRVPMWTAHAGVIAGALDDVGMRPLPSAPRPREFFVRAEASAADMNRAVLEVTETTGWRFLHGWWAEEGGGALAEMTTADPALDWTADDVHRVGRLVADRAGGTR